MEFNITFPEKIISNINIGGMIMVSVIFILGFIIFMRYSAKIMPAFLGLLAYLLFVVAGVEIVTLILSNIPVIGNLLLETVGMFCITRAVITALLIHLTRYLIISFTNRNQDITLGNALICGVGMATCPSIIMGLELISISSLGTLINTEGLSTLVADMTAEELNMLVDMVKQTVEIPPVYFLLRVINNSIDVVYHVAACLIIYAIIKKGLPKFWYAIAIVFNVILQSASMFADYQVFTDYMMLTITKGIILICVIVCVLKIDAKYLGGELRSFDKIRNKPSGSMPKFGKLKNR